MLSQFLGLFFGSFPPSSSEVFWSDPTSWMAPCSTLLLWEIPGQFCPYCSWSWCQNPVSQPAWKSPPPTFAGRLEWTSSVAGIELACHTFAGPEWTEHKQSAGLVSPRSQGQAQKGQVEMVYVLVWYGTRGFHHGVPRLDSAARAERLSRAGGT